MEDGLNQPLTSTKPKRKRKNKKRNPENKKLACKDCGRKFYFNCQLNFHRLVHTGEKPYACNVCGKSFNTPYSLKNHKYIHSDEKPFNCTFCKYACRDSSTLRKHQAKHMGIETIYQCKMCSKSYKSKYQLKSHVAETHLNVNLKKLPCKRCDKLFKTTSQLNTHIKLVHDRAKCGHCPVCNIYLPNMNNLGSHLATHVDAKPYVCNVAGCSSAYKDKGSLTKHMVKHRPDDQFPCDFCGRLFPARHRLHYHIEKVHGKRKRVQCDYCGVWFYSKAYLVNHITKKHAKRRKTYICDSCGFKAYNKPGLVMHLKYHNQNDRECKICHTVYKKFIYLKQHYKKTHNIAYKTKKRQTLVIKDEPSDDASVHSIDLFEIDKTEIPDGESNPDTVQPQHEMETVIECERLRDIPRDVFDQFYVQHIKKCNLEDDKLKESTEKAYNENIDEKALEYVKKSKIKMLEEARRKEAMQALERARQIYNERIKNLVEAAAVKNKKPIKIKMFKNKQSVCSKSDQNDKDEPTNKWDSSSGKDDVQRDNKNKLTSDDDEKIFKIETDDDQKPIKADGDNHITDINDRIELDIDKNELIDDYDPEKLSNDEKNDVITDNDEKKDIDKEPTNGGDEISEVDTNVDESDDMFNCKKQKNTKINFNSHQCYICFKLYETKQELLDHCKHHFDVCNDGFLKKCPLCPYVTKRSIARHLRLRHGVNVKVPYGRIQDKHNNVDGCRYYFELDDPLVRKMEVIPSVRNLNKMASMKIDKKHREEKDRMLTKTKLVRKGQEWVVETEKISIDNNVIIPEFDSDALKQLDIKVGDSDSYLDGLKKMSRIAKKSGNTMFFPCQSCDKICRNFAALKLHTRKHEANPKPFKKKVWKHKLKDAPVKLKSVKTITPKTDNRTAKPKPIKNKHKCDPELKQFYENNIRGGDIEFWQFLKIFNKMNRDNIKDFKDLEGRHEYGIVYPEVVDGDEIKNKEIDRESKPKQEITPVTKDGGQKFKNHTKVNKNLKTKKDIYKKVIRISKRVHMKRNLIKQKLRDKIAQNSKITKVDRNLAKHT